VFWLRQGDVFFFLDVIAQLRFVVEIATASIPSNAGLEAVTARTFDGSLCPSGGFLFFFFLWSDPFFFRRDVAFQFVASFLSKDRRLSIFLDNVLGGDAARPKKNHHELVRRRVAMRRMSALSRRAR